MYWIKTHFLFNSIKNRNESFSYLKSKSFQMHHFIQYYSENTSLKWLIQCFWITLYRTTLPRKVKIQCFLHFLMIMLKVLPYISKPFFFYKVATETYVYMFSTLNWLKITFFQFLGIIETFFKNHSAFSITRKFHLQYFIFHDKQYIDIK